MSLDLQKVVRGTTSMEKESKGNIEQGVQKTGRRRGEQS